MSYTFTAPQQIEINDAFALGPMPNQSGNFQAFYSKIAEILTTEVNGIRPDSLPDVLKPRIWVEGALKTMSNYRVNPIALHLNFGSTIETEKSYLLAIDLTKSRTFFGLNSKDIQYSIISTKSKRLSPVSILPISERVTLSFFASSLCDSPMFFLCSINISLNVVCTVEYIDFLNFKLLIETILWVLHNAPVLGANIFMNKTP